MIPKELLRLSREDAQQPLFDDGPAWEKHWWGMPHFEMKDCRPSRTISINFATDADVAEFIKATGLPVTRTTDSIWFPHQKPLNGQYFWDGPKRDSRYPICIPSKGRHDTQTTGSALDRLGVSYRFFVEEHEYDLYCAALGEGKVVKLPFSNLGQGSIPARNFIWDWAAERGHSRHWVIDDNIATFTRMTANRRLCVYGGGFFSAMEDFVDRYENVAMAGPHDQGFVKDREPASNKPFLLNSRVYSCILIDTSLPHRWRGRYNEDTDLSLRVLKDGYCTMLFYALLMNKPGTVGSKAKAQKGGNTDNVYNTGDHRLAFAKSLEEQHPDVVKVVWKFNRWHHEVDYAPFKNNQPRYAAGVTPIAAENEYGMRLCRKDTPIELEEPEETRDDSEGFDE